MLFTLPHVLDRSAERMPEKEAIRFGGRGVRYSDLAGRSNSLAHALIAAGVRRGDRVGIYAEKSVEAVVAMYGILKAGAVYVPLDPSLPEARLNRWIRDCGIRHLVTRDSMTRVLGGLFVAGAELDCILGCPSRPDLPASFVSWDEVYAMPGQAAPDVGTIDLDPAYILYTSGSTGEPKGMVHTHRSALSFVRWAARTYSLRTDDRLANHAPLHFDLSVFDFFSAAFSGSTTVIVPEAHRKFPASLSKLLEDERVSIWYSVPVALIHLLLRGALEKRDLRSLRWIIFGGESFPIQHLRRLMELLPGARFTNVYGVTESNVCTCFHVPPLTAESVDPIPIGRICENQEALVVDVEDRPVDPGQVGELLIRGSTVMSGYWARPDLNRNVFLRRPSVCGEQLYLRTGDLVRRLADGNFQLVGRKDRQVKMRGYRIVLDEVETALLSHGGVAEAAVFSTPDQEGSLQLRAAVVLRDREVVTSSELKDYLRELLAWYAVPVSVEIVDSFPRTSTDKIDRRRLEADFGHAAED